VKMFLGAMATVLLMGGSAAAQQQMVFTAWGGTTQDAQYASWGVPFTAETGIAVVQDGPTDYGKLRAMVEAGSVTWDVVDVEYEYALQAAEKGLLEPLDFSIIDRAAIDPRFVTDHVVGSFYFSFVIGYLPASYPDAKPRTMADLFDTAKFPGKRAFYKWAAPGTIEAALIADGVDPANLYPLDLDRAFAKLDTIKSDILWWGGGAQSQQTLAAGETPIGLFWNPRLTALINDGVPVEISWEQNLTAADALVVPKGTPNREAAMRFIAEAVSAEGQSELARQTGLSPITPAALDLLDPELRAVLPDSQTESQIKTDLAYWAANRDMISERWYAWQAE